ncbi:MAG: HAD family hydrolase [Clostridia bacterium]|nr:HAD family hydrolase [Clostridia bacterium]
MKYTHILWDFNGTILDDVEAGIKSVNKLLSERGLPIIGSIADYHAVFGFPIIDYYRRLGFDFDKEPYEVIAPLWVEQYLINVKDSPIYDDVRSTAEVFRKMGLKQIILSATEIDMLKAQLSDLGLENTFDSILGLDNIHAESKVKLAEKWRAENQNACPLVIGDTVHDAEVAKAIGADCILVARGHQSRKTLEECNCKITNTLSEIIKKHLQ